MNWTKCSDCKPPDDAMYLVAIGPMSDGKRFVRTAWFHPFSPDDGGWSGLVMYMADRITHWMPLPEPPEVP